MKQRFHFYVAVKAKVKVLSRVRLFATPWTKESMEFSGQTCGKGSLSLLRGIFPTQDWTQVLCIAGRFFTSWATREIQMRRLFAKTQAVFAAKILIMEENINRDRGQPLACMK